MYGPILQMMGFVGPMMNAVLPVCVPPNTSVIFKLVNQVVVIPNLNRTDFIHPVRITIEINRILSEFVDV
jgi:hypothetical protein